MIEYSKKDIINSLKKVGLKKNDTIYLSFELYKFGNLKEAKSKNDYYKSFFDSINKIIGKKGTIAVNTYTFQTLRFGKKFDYKRTKCTSGEFSEYIRKRKGSLRSNHPVFSVSALGRHKKYICNNNSYHNYGYGSPYQKFLDLDGKLLNLGMDPCFNPFFHVAEFLVGVPFYYNKLTKVKYEKNNFNIKKYFSSSERYLNLNITRWNKENLIKLKKNMLKKNILNSADLGSSQLHLMSAREYMKEVLDFLVIDQFAFLNNLNFKKGVMPFK